MKSLKDYVEFPYEEQYIVEMATIDKKAHFGNETYRIAIHGPSSKDRDYPHIHIYLSNDNTLQLFNFEISLIDILCYDEINLICQRDKKKHINRKNRKNCSWEGYRRLKEDFEDWLEQKPSGIRGDFNTNLEACVWFCNNEAPSDDFVKNYIKSKGMKILDKYKNIIDNYE